MSSTCFLRSDNSASRIASWNWLWNSEAMRRSLLVHCPSVRSTVGSSFGPIAISATTAMSSSSLQPISNMEASTPRGARCAGAPPIYAARRRVAAGASASAGLARLRDGRRWSGRRLVVDRLRVALGGLGLGFFFFREPFLERLDALGEIAHQLRDLAAPAEQQKAHGQNQNPVPNAH